MPRHDFFFLSYKIVGFLLYTLWLYAIAFIEVVAKYAQQVDLYCSLAA